MDAIKSIIECLTGGLREPSHLTVKSKKTPPPYENDPAAEELAARILNTLFTSEKSGEDLTFQLQALVSTTSWKESLARRVLDGIVGALESGRILVGTMKETYDKVQVVAEEFVHEHPILTAVLVTVIAIGILELLVPWAVEALGFGELGPIEGSFAAWWQSTFPDAEAGSLFSYLQRLGMKWGKA